MDIVTAIENRRSVKQFDPNHRMTLEEEERLLQLTMLSPTAFNIQHWRFVVVRDPALRQSLRRISWNQSQVTDASLLVIVCADLGAWHKDPARYWRHAPQGVREFLLPAMRRCYEGNAQMQRDEGLRSCGIAAQSLMLAAQGMGYDSCPMTGFDFDAVGREINLPADHLLALFVAIGKPLRPANIRSGQLSLEEVRVVDRF
ncbi:MAG: nitroreductase family protein [Magnetococcus sp. MYC-9]